MGTTSLEKRAIPDGNLRLEEPVLPLSRIVYSNKELLVLALDDPSEENGMCHQYLISTHNEDVPQMITFQKGCVEEHGINGITHHQLLATLEDRLRCFQLGPFSSTLNELALLSIQTAKSFGSGIKEVTKRVLGSPHSSKKAPKKCNRLVDETQTLCVFVTDQPDPNAGGACHEYVVNDHDNRQVVSINFQHGPVNEYGINGLQHIELLSVLEDRLRSAIINGFGSIEDEFLLNHIQSAISADQERTRRRTLAGMEGFNRGAKGVEK